MDVSTTVCGIKFKNPVGTAAGPGAKDGATLLTAAEGGAGYLVTKTINVKPAIVPKPCIEKLPHGMLNCETWSEISYEQWIEKEFKTAKQAKLPLIASIGYSPSDVQKLGPLMEEAGADAIEFSIHYLGNDMKPALDVAKALKSVVKIPVFPKISPHYKVGELAYELEKAGMDGIVGINSVGPCLHINIETGKPLLADKGTGWLSGEMIKPVGTRCVAEIAKKVSIPIIGVGGISTGKDAIEYIMAGASAVQVCTAAIVNGPATYGKIADEIKQFLESHNYSSLEDIRGIALDKINI